MADKKPYSTGPFTVKKLIEALQKCENQDAPVNVYLVDSLSDEPYRKCARYAIELVDDNFDDHRMVDLNIASDTEFAG